jgi:hypothetical protein
VLVESLLPIGRRHALERARRRSTGVGHEYVDGSAQGLGSLRNQRRRIAGLGYVAGDTDGANLGGSRCDARGIARYDRNSNAFRHQLPCHGLAQPFGSSGP